ncbi:MAG: hypothetical protein ACTSRL_14455 [Candidatus Helarchaeota archaeon]
MEQVSNRITENLLLIYLLAFLAGLIPFLGILVYYNWDISQFWTIGFLTSLMTVSGSVMKFIGGLGLILTYAWGCAFALKLFSPQIKGRRNLAERLKLILILGSFALAAYGIYNILTSLTSLPDITLLTYLFTIYGICSLMLVVYLIPAIKEEFQPIAKPTRWERIKGKFGGFKYSLWKGYQTRVRKDFGKVFAKEYDHYKTDLEDMRDQLSGVLLAPITIIFIGFLPLFGVSIILWLRIFSQAKKPFLKLEKLLLSISIGCLLVFAIILFIVITDPFLMAIFNIVYGIGLIFSVILFMYVLSKA